MVASCQHVYMYYSSQILDDFSAVTHKRTHKAPAEEAARLFKLRERAEGVTKQQQRREFLHLSACRVPYMSGCVYVSECDY